MSNKVRKEGESIKQWRDRLRQENRNSNTIDGGELDPVIVEYDPNNSITNGYRTLGSKSNDYRVNQSSIFGERDYNPNPSLATRLLNNITDRLKLTSPPTYKDGYGRTLNAEVPLSESAQGQELKRMGQTAMNTAALASIPFGAKYLYLSPLATAAGAAAGYAASEGTGLALDAADSALKKHAGLQLSNTQKAIPQFTAGLIAGGAGFNWGRGVTKRAIETAMHTTSAQNPLRDLKEGVRFAHKNGQIPNVFKYIFTGKNENGISNTLGRGWNYMTSKPEITTGHYTGLYGQNVTVGVPADADDMVKTFLYGTPLKNMTRITTPNKYGLHTNYVYKKYPGKNVEVYEMGPLSGQTAVPEHLVTPQKASDSHTPIFGKGLDGKNIALDAGGHRVEHGITNEGKRVHREQDIWKFNSKEYAKRWEGEGAVPPSLPIRALLKWGLDITDHHGNPVIVRTPWTTY